MSVEIYTINVININGEDYASGDAIPHLRWRLDDKTENEMHEAYIADITEDSIIVYSLIDESPTNNIEIKIDDIIC